MNLILILSKGKMHMLLFFDWKWRLLQTFDFKYVYFKLSTIQTNITNWSFDPYDLQYFGKWILRSVYTAALGNTLLKYMNNLTYLHFLSLSWTTHTIVQYKSDEQSQFSVVINVTGFSHLANSITRSRETR